MDNMTMDLFETPPDAIRTSRSAPNVKPEVDFTPFLEEAFIESGRKTAMKALDPEQKAALVAAVGVVATAKRAAYQRACAGEHLPSFDWLACQPALASATALLSQHFIGPGVIPMAPV